MLVALFALASMATAQTTTPAAVAAAPAAPVAVETVSKTEVSAELGYEGKYIFRGQKITNDIVTGTVSVALPTQTELSVVAYQNVNDDDVSVNDEFDITLSQGYSIDKVTTLTVGGTGYFYPRASNKAGETAYSLEAFAAIGYDAFLSPTFTAGYDFYLKQIFGEGTLSQDIKLPFLANNWKIVPAVAVGWANANDLYPALKGKPVHDSYFYGTGKVDLVYEIKNVVVTAGYRYNYIDNSATDHTSWAGATVAVRF